MITKRLIVLTDIERGFEQDDIQSMVRLMLYANEIDIEGLIATTSCFYHDGARENAGRFQKRQLPRRPRPL